jgi:hypothetical protein
MRKIGKIILPSGFKPRLVKKLQKRRNCYESADGRLLLWLLLSLTLCADTASTPTAK